LNSYKATKKKESIDFLDNPILYGFLRMRHPENFVYKKYYINRTLFYKNSDEIINKDLDICKNLICLSTGTVKVFFV
jgi:hypothetical protein